MVAIEFVDVVAEWLRRQTAVKILRCAFLFLIWVKVDPSAFLFCDLLWPTNFPFSWPIISHFPFTCFRYKTQRRVSFFSSVFLAHSVVQVDSGYVDEMRPPVSILCDAIPSLCSYWKLTIFYIFFFIKCIDYYLYVILKSLSTMLADQLSCKNNTN